MGTPKARTSGSHTGALGSYTELGPPDRTSPAGSSFRISSTAAVHGRMAEKTCCSRIRRAISCVYCPPKSSTTIPCFMLTVPPGSLRVAISVFPLTGSPTHYLEGDFGLVSETRARRTTRWSPVNPPRQSPSLSNHPIVRSKTSQEQRADRSQHAHAYLSTIFTSFFGTTTVFVTVFPSIRTEILGSLSARSSVSSSPRFASTRIFPRSLPLI